MSKIAHGMKWEREPENKAETVDGKEVWEEVERGAATKKVLQECQF